MCEHRYSRILLWFCVCSGEICGQVGGSGEGEVVQNGAFSDAAWVYTVSRISGLRALPVCSGKEGDDTCEQKGLGFAHI